MSLANCHSDSWQKALFIINQISTYCQTISCKGLCSVKLRCCREVTKLEIKVPPFFEYMYLKVRKSQKQFFCNPFPKKATKIFGRISALASKMGQIKNLSTHHYIIQHVFTIIKYCYFFDFTHYRGQGRNPSKTFGRFLGNGVKKNCF